MADRDAPIVAAEPVAPRHDPIPTRARLGTPLASVLALVATLLGLVVLAWTVLFVTKGRFLRHSFERIASRQMHRDVKVGGDFQLYFNPFNLEFLAEKMTISNADWAKADNPNFFTADRIHTRIATWSLVTGKHRVNWLSLRNSRVDLQWNKAGQNSWTFSGEGKPLELPLIRRALVAGTWLHYADPRMRIVADIHLEPIQARNTQFATSVRFDGTGTARGTPFTMNGALLTPNATVAGGRNQLELHANAVRSQMDVSGTLPGATEIEGADLHMKLRGRNLADVFELMGVAVPATRSYHLTSALTKRGNEWRFTGLKGRFGDSDLAGKLTVTMREPRLFLAANLHTTTLDILDAGPFIGYNPDKLDAQGAKGVVKQVNGTPRLLPDSTLRIEALKNFDADVDWTIMRVRAKSLPVSDVTLGLDLKDRLLKLSPLNFAMARGTVSSDIVINARDPRVLTDYDIRLSPTPMGTLLAGWGVEQSGTSGMLKARVQMHGVGDTVHKSLATSNGRIAVIIPKGTMWTRNIQLSELDIGVFIQKMFEKKLKQPVEINCGLVAFTVRDGVGSADPILIDTKGNVITGRGAFSFKDESLNFALRADSKKFSLFSGQSPVGIDGYFAKPAINPISPQLIARGAVGVGLGVLASPLAGILAFVDIGDAKAADCGPVLEGARAYAQRDKKGRPREDVGHGTPVTRGG